MTICKFIVTFLYALSCYSCIFNFLQILVSELTAQFSNYVTTTMGVDDSVFFWTGAFNIFVILYSNRFGKVSQTIFAVLILIIIFAITVLVYSLANTKIDPAIISASIIFIPVLLLTLFSKIAPEQK